MEKLFEIFGSRKAAAEAIGVQPEVLSMVKSGKRKFTPAMCKRIEEATHGQIKRVDLRPDIFG